MAEKQSLVIEANTREINGKQVRGLRAEGLIHDIQRDNVSDLVSHIDFYQVKMTEKLTATIPLKFVGVPSAVKELGGTLMHPMSEVEVESLPADLPHEIEVDVSGLSGFDQVVRVSDLKVDRS